MLGGLVSLPGVARAATRFSLPAGTGPLRPLGGLVLDDPALGFGGLSGLDLTAKLDLTGVGDTGYWFTARLRLDADGLAGLDDVRVGRLRDTEGRLLGRTERDAECLARLPDGSFLVGFERRHRIDAYRTIDAPAVPVPGPPGLERAPRNGGLESLAVLADGRWLALCEKLPPEDAPEGLRQGWIGGPRAWTPVAYRPEAGFDPTDAAGLPDGGALVLERRFSLWGGFSARLVRVSAAALAGGGVLSGDVLLKLTGAWPEENWEGLAVARHAGRTVVAMVSDDNQNAWQRQLLLLFALQDG